jgi:hypothetical protein
MKAVFANALSRAFANAATTMGVSILLNGEAVQAVVSESEYMTLPEEGGVNAGGELTVRMARTAFDEFGKGGDPRRNQFTIDSMKYRVVTVKSLPENPILEFLVRQDQ